MSTPIPANFTDPAPTSYSAHEKRTRIFAIVAASSGNLVEWFDFYVYAFAAIYFAPAFSTTPVAPRRYEARPRSHPGESAAP